MTAAYDEYDYPAYWEKRQYEHESEVIALKSFLSQIPKIKKIIDIGAGFGRLTPYYAFRAKKVVLTDPSSKLLKEARKRLVYENVDFVQACLDKTDKKFRKGSFDVVVMVRVLHHIENPRQTFSVVERLLSRGGYLILEFPNKVHWKAVWANFAKGDFTYPLDIFTSDRRKRKKALPFYNFHPDEVKQELKDHDFRLIQTRSVSNIRSPLVKKYIPLSVLVFFERNLQKILASISFGPSIFILAQKKG